MFWSRTNNVYVPALRLLQLLVDENGELLKLYRYSGVPPLTLLTTSEAFSAPQVSGTAVTEIDCGPAIMASGSNESIIHPLASVTEMV